MEACYSELGLVGEFAIKIWGYCMKNGNRHCTGRFLKGADDKLSPTTLCSNQLWWSTLIFQPPALQLRTVVIR